LDDEAVDEDEEEDGEAEGNFRNTSGLDFDAITLEVHSFESISWKDLDDLNADVNGGDDVGEVFSEEEAVAVAVTVAVDVCWSCCCCST